MNPKSKTLEKRKEVFNKIEIALTMPDLNLFATRRRFLDFRKKAEKEAIRFLPAKEFLRF